MIPNTKNLLSKISSHYQLSSGSPHGLPHWGRVKTNGFRIAKYTEGVNLEIVELFAYFHDSCRENDYHDPGHGLRAAIFAETLRGKYFTLKDDEFSLFSYACAHHTLGATDADITIQCCWDSDRLDLGRVGIIPNPKFLCTNYAKRSDVIEWALGRSMKHEVIF